VSHEHSTSRRDFLHAGAAAAAGLLAVPASGLSVTPAGGNARVTPNEGDPLLLRSTAPEGRLLPFPLSSVKLRPGVQAADLAAHRRYIAALEPDRLLHSFRLTASLPSTVTPYGGWEAPNNELRGHSAGHYLSACAMMWAGHGDRELKARGDRIVSELATCQERLRSGYLSAFPEELFDRLRADVRVWAPFYTLHKVMAGLLDMHLDAGNAQALDVLVKMATWTERWAQPLQESHMQRVLEREYGGMNELFYNLAAVTGEERWIRLAQRFDHERVFSPLAAGRDELKGLHVNTLIPKVIGAARRYELLGDPRARDIAQYFWQQVVTRRSYATGGTSNGESWDAEPGILSTELSGYTHECCVTYNMLKLSRHVFSWTGDARAMDYFERAHYNGILGTVHPRDGHSLYYLPLQSGYWKLFGDPEQSFWCCNGSSMESFAKVADTVYFHDDRGIYVNLFMASEVDWQEKGVRLVQETRFPDEGRTTLTVHTNAPVRMPLRVRIPNWARSGGVVRLNGRALETFASPSSYLVIDRTWRTGDRVEVELPMALHVAATPDNPSVQAMMYGPLVLAGRMGAEGLTPGILRAEPTRPRTIPEYKGAPTAAPQIRVSATNPTGWVRQRAGGAPPTFGLVGQEREMELVPLHRVMDERYAVYWSTTRSG